MDECEVAWRKKDKELTAADKNCNSLQDMVHLKFGFPVFENNYRKYGIDYTLKDNQKKTMKRLSGGNSCDKVVKCLWQWQAVEGWNCTVGAES